MRSALAVVVFLLLSFSAAAFGGQFTPGPWYAALDKPGWTPPSWLFGPVWTVLYVTIGVAGWMIWRQRPQAGVGLALSAWAVQLVLNALWPWLFFGLHRIDLALLELSALWLAIAVTVGLFWRLRPAAGALLLPYLAWVSFAWFLNFTIWRLNA